MAFICRKTAAQICAAEWVFRSRLERERERRGTRSCMRPIVLSGDVPAALASLLLVTSVESIDTIWSLLTPLVKWVHWNSKFFLWILTFGHLTVAIPPLWHLPVSWQCDCVICCLMTMSLPNCLCPPSSSICCHPPILENQHISPPSSHYKYPAPTGSPHRIVVLSMVCWCVTLLAPYKGVSTCLACLWVCLPACLPASFILHPASLSSGQLTSSGSPLLSLLLTYSPSASTSSPLPVCARIKNNISIWILLKICGRKFELLTRILNESVKLLTVLNGSMRHSIMILRLQSEDIQTKIEWNINESSCLHIISAVRQYYCPLCSWGQRQPVTSLIQTCLAG